MDGQKAARLKEDWRNRARVHSQVHTQHAKPLAERLEPSPRSEHVRVEDEVPTRVVSGAVGLDEACDGCQRPRSRQCLLVYTAQSSAHPCWR
jgi:hypothetical protein